tara:strand:+ start:4286 stop:4726 length:441 start_codon:yes stop_codon:yes gene_type:complete
MFKHLILFLFLSYSLFGQAYIRPDQKTQNNDLRSFKNYFEIRSLEKENYSFKLNVINNDQYIVIYGQDNESLRVSADVSEKIDNKYVSEFIKMKYSMPRVSKGTCFESFELVMRGEKQKICRDEIKKLKIVEEIIASLEAIKSSKK